MAVLDSAEARRRGASGRAQRLAYLQRKSATRRARIPAMRAAGLTLYVMAAALGCHVNTLNRDIARLKREGLL